ncbi:hypothetical protein [Rhodobacter sp. NSM]|uniref:hypothetical protein n=1 Tax=Rhodobacter sp. NSM TaxID=3457501 RepID=UPI003FCF45C2
MKILTVSYGSFSCRLEGFDDPFTTMKTIADYFRHLSETEGEPDPAALQELAARDSEGKVEAEATPAGVVLRVEKAAAAEPDSLSARLLRLRSAMDEARHPRPQPPSPTPHAMSGPASSARPRDVGEDRPSPGPQAAAATPGEPHAVEGNTAAPVERRGDAEAPLALHPTVPEGSARDTSGRHPQVAVDASAGQPGLPLRLEAPDLLPAGTPGDPAPPQAGEGDAALRAFIAAAKAQQEQEDAEERARTLERARARVVRIRTEPDPRLLKELARIERDLAPEGHRHAAGRQLAEATGEDAVERILDKTRNEMRAPESRRRISALSHLKAAVAATVAERMSGGLPSEGEGSRLDAYRDDLARVVHPSSGAEVEDRQAEPLVLASDQRVDAGQDPLAGEDDPDFDISSPASRTADGPEPDGRSPRAAWEDLLVEEDEDEDLSPLDTADFADFARRIGVRDLPGLIQAAAAYAEVVEKRPHVSRPHLMRSVASVEFEGDAGREATLRSFGALLREGLIEKVRRGQFALTDRSPYRGAARRLGR